MSPRDVLRGRGPGDLWVPPEPPEPVEGRAEDVLAMIGDDRALAVTFGLYEEDTYEVCDIDQIDIDADASEHLRAYMAERGTDEGLMVVRRSVPVAVVGMQEGWEAPVVVRLPDHGEAERLRAAWSPQVASAADLDRPVIRQPRSGYGEIMALTTERDALRSTLDDVARRLCDRGWGHERDGAAPYLHDHEIAARVDDVLVELHRAEEERADVIAERDALRAEVARLRAAALAAIVAAFRSGNMAGHEGTVEGVWSCDPDFDAAEDYLLDALAEVFDG